MNETPEDILCTSLKDAFMSSGEIHFEQIIEVIQEVEARCYYRFGEKQLWQVCYDAKNYFVDEMQNNEYDTPLSEWNILEGEDPLEQREIRLDYWEAMRPQKIRKVELVNMLNKGKF